MRVNELFDIGIGKECLIIGGGLSVNEFDFNLSKDMVKIAVNDAFPENVKIDYLVYGDKEFVPKFKKMANRDQLEGVNIISNMNFPPNREHYDFTLDDFSQVGFIVSHSDNTGLKALIIAKHIMKFDKVYLIGFDFHTRLVDGKEQSHFIGDLTGQDEKYIDEMMVRDHFKRLTVMINQFNIITDTTGIYNCYKESSLTKFEKKIPQEVEYVSSR